MTFVYIMIALSLSLNAAICLYMIFNYICALFHNNKGIDLMEDALEHLEHKMEYKRTLKMERRMQKCDKKLQSRRNRGVGKYAESVRRLERA